MPPAVCRLSLSRPVPMCSVQGPLHPTATAGASDPLLAAGSLAGRRSFRAAPPRAHGWGALPVAPGGVAPCRAPWPQQPRAPHPPRSTANGAGAAENPVAVAGAVPFNSTGRPMSVALLAALTAVVALLDADVLPGGSAAINMMRPWLAAVAASWALGFAAVPALRYLKFGQVIREDGPQAHLKKGGTPTMGGVWFVPVGMLTAMFFTGVSDIVLALSAATTGFWLVGLYDDAQILLKRSNAGISPKVKLGLQVAVGAAFCFWLRGMWMETLVASNSYPTGAEVAEAFKRLHSIVLPLGGRIFLGPIYWALSLFTLAAESNGVNLTDGLDGLAAGTVAIAFISMAVALVPFHSLCVFCVSMAGACMGFLLHNHNPAKVFMGDTGSLALGGALGLVAIASRGIVPLLAASMVFAAEAVSVIVQVAYYKRTKGPDGVGKRLFRMAPIHHHFELGGMGERGVVWRFYAAQGACGLVAALLGWGCFLE